MWHTFYVSKSNRPQIELDRSIVWNTHNTVFGSKRQAICALAVYFLHSTRLMSRDSIVDRHWPPATDCCQRYLPCCEPAFDVADNLGRFNVRSVQAREWLRLWMDSNGKMETSHPIQGTFGNEFLSIYNHCGLMAAWSRKSSKIFCLFWRKTPYRKIFKILFRKDSSPHLAYGKSVKSCAYLTKTKFRLALQLSLLCGSRSKSARASPRQCTQSAPDFIKSVHFRREHRQSATQNESNIQPNKYDRLSDIQSWKKINWKRP